MKNTSWTIVAVAVVAIFGGMIWYSGQPGKYDGFATCLKDNGATFYGAFWCPHCQDQKKLFGKSASKLNYVECSTPNGQGQLQVCIDAKVETYPTWDFTANGTTTRKTGVLSFAELSNFTGCEIAAD